jgi:hypothetical protein
MYVAKQEGIKEIILHYLFKGPSLYSDQIITSMTILGRALGAVLKYDWYGYWLEEEFCAFASFA